MLKVGYVEVEMIKVGDRSKFGLNCYVHSSAEVGPDCQFGANVVIGPNVRIGANCVFKSGVVIGEMGFGYARDRSGRWVPKPHEFSVTLGDDVHVGANTCIDQGSWRETVIQDGARIDNLVHIAHNVFVGERVIVVAQAELSGSVVVRDDVWIGPRACVKERLEIGERALVGMGAVVIRDVPPNVTVAGNPARVINDHVGVRESM